MNADLQRLIELQRLDSIVLDAQRRIADQPARLLALDSRLNIARQHVATAKEQLAHSQSARREVEKELAVQQGRLSKYRDQLMAVKTNIEYQAMQKEIAFAETEVKTFEDRILEFMLAGDELTAAVKKADMDLVAEQKAVDTEQKTLTAEMHELERLMEATSALRADVVKGLDPKVLATFQLVGSRKNGIAVAEARDGICTICHVRLRPQVFNTVRRGDDILQCDSCNRILYFAPTAAPAAAPAPTS